MARFWYPLATALLLLGPAASSESQRSATLSTRQVYERVVHTLVQVQSSRGHGSGWLLAQAGRPLVITNNHVVEGSSQFTVRFYSGSGQAPVAVRAQVVRRSSRIDLAVLRLLSDPPASATPFALPRETATVFRGDAVVLGGNPVAGGAVLAFQTTAGVVTGSVSGQAYSPCGVGRSCVIVDAASLGGSSGGPAFNMSGQFVGMLWGGPQQAVRVGGQTLRDVNVATAAFAYLIHAQTVSNELRSFEQNE